MNNSVEQKNKTPHNIYIVGMMKQFTPPGLHLLVWLPMVCPSFTMLKILQILLKIATRNSEGGILKHHS